MALEATLKETLLRRYLAKEHSHLQVTEDELAKLVLDPLTDAASGAGLRAAAERLERARCPRSGSARPR